jgi:hypothetical protein
MCGCLDVGAATESKKSHWKCRLTVMQTTTVLFWMLLEEDLLRRKVVLFNGECKRKFCRISARGRMKNQVNVYEYVLLQETLRIFVSVISVLKTVPKPTRRRMTKKQEDSKAEFSS